MYEDFSTKMAHVITEYSQPVNPGDFVVVQATTLAEPLIKAVYEAIVRRGGHPMVLAQVPGLQDIFMELANEQQLQYQNPLIEQVIDQVDVLYNIMALTNPKAGGSYAPHRVAMQQIANRPMMEKYMQRIADGSLRWIIFPFPTDAMAQEAETSLLAYTKFVYEACAFHLDDPIAYWQAMHNRQEKLVDYLSTKSEIVVRGPDIDLSFNVAGRAWVNCDGHLNFPDGEIFTGPVENSVNGYVNFNMRTVYDGREVNGVRLVYEDGHIVDAQADKGQEWLLAKLDTDEGARRMGEFAIGTNFNIKDVTGNTLFDEKIGGTIHMAVGFSIPESLGQNVSVVHWDMVHDMAQSEIYADGELFYQHGQFVIDF